MARFSRRRRMELQLWAQDYALELSCEPPEDWPVAARVETEALLPLWHGDYSQGLSATFAAVNGLRLVTAGHVNLSKADEQRLLEKAWRWRLERGPIRPDRGLRQTDWLRMVEAICHTFMRRHGQFITLNQPWQYASPCREEFFTTIERLIVGRHVILSLFAGAHYSVIRGYTSSSLLLFDSGERCWMQRGSISLVGAARARHCISPRATLALRRSL